MEKLRKMVTRALRFAKRLVRRLKGRKTVHFLHIGKTGGSAVKHAMSGCAPRRYMLRFCDHHVSLRDIPRGDGVIFFLRDPISRFVSGFYSGQRQGQPRYFYPWSDDEEAAFSVFDTPNALAMALSSDDAAEKEKAERAMGAIRHVRDSYSKWFVSERYLRERWGDVFFFGFQESLNEDFEALSRKLGLPESIGLPEDNVTAHRNPNGLDRSLSPEAADNLRAWYREDYRFMELCRALGGRA